MAGRPLVTIRRACRARLAMPGVFVPVAGAGLLLVGLFQTGTKGALGTAGGTVVACFPTPAPRQVAAATLRLRLPSQ